MLLKNGSHFGMARGFVNGNAARVPAIRSEHTARCRVIPIQGYCGKRRWAGLPHLGFGIEPRDILNQQIDLVRLRAVVDAADVPIAVHQQQFLGVQECVARAT